MTRTNSPRLLVAAIVAIALGAALPTANAQSSTAQAESLFRQGKALLAEGKINDACAAFDASQKLDPTLATLLNQASCREKNGQLATAWGLFLDAERQSRAAIDAPTRQMHQVAIDHAAKLEPRLSTLAITVSADARIRGLEVLRNHEPVDPGAWNKALPVDGGSFKIVARAPGNAEWSSTIAVAAERDAKTIEIPKLKAAALRPAPMTATAPASPLQPGTTPDPHTQPGSAPTERPRPTLLPLALGGASLAFVAGAIGFELSARSAFDRSRREIDDTRQDALWRSANNRRYIAAGLGVAGIACAGTAVWLYLRHDHEASPSTTHTRRPSLQPLLASDRVGLALQGSY